MEENENELKIVDSLFTFEIYDKHTRESIEPDGQIKVETLDPDYKKFDYSFDFFIKKIKDVQGVALFGKDSVPDRACRVTFTDGTYVYSTKSHSVFMKSIWKDYYRQMYDYYNHQQIRENINQIIAEEEAMSILEHKKGNNGNSEQQTETK